MSTSGSLTTANGVVVTRQVRPGDAAGPFEIAVGNDTDLYRAAGAARDFFSVALEYRVGAATDGADAEKSNVDRFHRAVRQ
jgi:hypothetical protein